MSEEETELRDLVAQTLENNGVLSRIRVYKIVFYYVVFFFFTIQCNLLISALYFNVYINFPMVFTNEFYRRKHLLGCYDI